MVANYINWINSRGTPFGNIAAVGHSLGAHVVGAAGKRTNQLIQAVIGLDPAGPLFSLDAPADRLHFTDATYVESIVTDAGRLGFEHPIAHGNFYPNWGNFRTHAKVSANSKLIYIQAHLSQDVVLI